MDQGNRISSPPASERGIIAPVDPAKDQRQTEQTNRCRSEDWPIHRRSSRTGVEAFLFRAGGCDRPQSVERRQIQSEIRL